MKLMKKLTALILILALVCAAAVSLAEGEKKTFRIGIVNLVDDASLNQIIASIRERLGEIEGVEFDIKEENCNLDFSVLEQILNNFIADEKDLIVAVTTPVAGMAKTMTEDNPIPVVFAAVSDPVGSGILDNLEAPGANLTGSSDYLDTNAIMNLIFSADPDAKNIALLYNSAEDASAAPIAAAQEFLTAKGVNFKEYTGSTITEVSQAADAIVADGMDAVFTPTDNTIMAAELSIWEKFAEAKIPHYTGADSFALNGAFVGYGVDYALLGRETADLIVEILVNGKSPAETPVLTFDNGTATVNTETCEAIGFNYDEIVKAFEPYCLQIKPITFAESFDELENK